MITVSDARPNAVAVIQPVGLRSSEPREHSLTVTLSLSGSEARFADKDIATQVVRQSLEGFAPLLGEGDRRAYSDVTLTTKARGKEGKSSTVVVSVEGTVVFAGRPGTVIIDHVRQVLSSEGYRVSLRERRECSENTCHSEVLLDWNLERNPPGWFSTTICGKHDYRTCLKCKSVYLLSASSAAGQAPSLTCEVCGMTMIAWGGSKVWTAELIVRNPPLPVAPTALS